jgi:hypothetical protein
MRKVKGCHSYTPRGDCRVSGSSAPGPSDGHTVNDIQGVELGTADFNFQLRAEADRSGPGRLYTVVYTATDSSGRQVVGSASIIAPVKGGGPAQTPVGGGAGRKAKPR